MHHCVCILQAQEEQSAARADYERRQAQVAKALDQYKPLADDLQKVRSATRPALGPGCQICRCSCPFANQSVAVQVHVASSQWIGRDMTLAA